MIEIAASNALVIVESAKDKRRLYIISRRSKQAEQEPSLRYIDTRDRASNLIFLDIFFGAANDCHRRRMRSMKWFRVKVTDSDDHLLTLTS